MNKLDVALKLLQLLNERKAIDSKVVAEKLDVSIRTAQRYLVELSILPCVVSRQSDHSYSLDPDYKLQEALKTAPNETRRVTPIQRQNITDAICLVCGGSAGGWDGINVLVGPKNVSNISRINKLTSIIRKKLKENRCSFP